MIKAHKIRLYPNNKQVTYFKKACGAARFAYNWALAESKRLYEEEGVRASGFDMAKRLTAIKREEFPWMYEITKHATERAVHNAQEALKKWWDPKLRNKAPKFKKKGKSRDSFYLGPDAAKTEEKRVCISKLGWVRAAQELRFGGRVLCASVSRTADKWFISVTVDTLTKSGEPLITGVLGVDVGVKSLAVTSDGEVFENPKALKRSEKKLRRLHKSVSRKQKGSSTHKRAVSKLARQHYKVACIRKDAQHKATTAITKSCSTVCVETLNVAGMMKNHKLAKAVSDAAMSEFLRQVGYKAKWNGVTALKADRFYPSSKTCSACGAVKDTLTLNERIYRCDTCDLVLDRDLNAALNLKQLAVVHTESLNACGDGSSGPDLVSGVKLLSVKQEGGVRD